MSRSDPARLDFSGGRRSPTSDPRCRRQSSAELPRGAGPKLPSGANRPRADDPRVARPESFAAALPCGELASLARAKRAPVQAVPDLLTPTAKAMSMAVASRDQDVGCPRAWLDGRRCGFCDGPVVGSVATMRVPPPGGLSTRSRPPSAVTRSLIPLSPLPLGRAPPTPSSRTSTRRTSCSTRAGPSALLARECLATLLSASAMAK